MATDFTIADVLAWARTKPADERYRYSDTKNCAVAQFVRHQGVPVYGPVRSRLERELGQYILDTPFYSGEHKFGELVTVLEAALAAETPKSNWLTIDAYMDDERVEA